MENMINNQEIIIMELEHSKSKAIEELEELKIKVEFKTDQLNEWKQKYEVKCLHYQYFYCTYFFKSIKHYNLLIMTYVRHCKKNVKCLDYKSIV